jgi:hypothetical protein
MSEGTQSTLFAMQRQVDNYLLLKLRKVLGLKGLSRPDGLKMISLDMAWSRKVSYYLNNFVALITF